MPIQPTIMLSASCTEPALRPWNDKAVTCTRISLTGRYGAENPLPSRER